LYCLLQVTTRSKNLSIYQKQPFITLIQIIYYVFHHYHLSLMPKRLVLYLLKALEHYYIAKEK